MNAFGRLASSISKIVDLKQSVLSGCVDVLVVPQQDGSLKSTSFHLRLGKFKILHNKDKEVDIYINGRKTGVVMKLGECGGAYFEHEKVVPVDESDEDLQAKSNTRGTLDDLAEEPNEEQLAYASWFSPEDAECKANSTVVLNDLNFYQESQNKNNMEFEYPEDDIFGLFGNTSQIRKRKMKIVKEKSLYPSPEQLEGFNLNHGRNTIMYKVHSDLQGAQGISGNIYYWPDNANIIVSDIDGTITKTDFRGHFAPMIGKDWSQPGITALFNNIERNGYHILYLTARPIGKSSQTKEFLDTLCQHGENLPQGPLILSPDRTGVSVHRELIAKRPDIFKIAALNDIKNLFPSNHNPFRAGFGNRETDVIAYHAVGIPAEKVFIVNPEGDIIHRDFTVSYSIINTMIKDIFPGVQNTNRELMFPEDEGEAVPIDLLDDTQHIMDGVRKVIS